MIKSATQYPVHSLISHDGNTVYRVPPYQREYSWQKPQWEDLFDDLVDADGAHFLGTIICLNATTDAVDANILELVDGQQRMTTITLLLAAVHSILNENKSELDEDSLADLSNLRRQLVRKQDQQLRLRPQFQGNNHADYITVMEAAGLPVKPELVSYMRSRRVWRCFRHFVDEIMDFAADQGVSLTVAAQRVLEAVNRAIIVKIEVDTHADAFVLFESLNNRGMALTPVDLIKNYLLAQAEGKAEMDITEAFERWNQMLTNLGDNYANHERFLRHFYNAFKAELPAVSKATVATRSNLIRIYETQVGQGVEGFLDAIVPASKIYGRIVGQVSKNEVLDAKLTSLGRAQGAPSYMLLLFLMARSEKKAIPSGEVVQVADLLIDFFVRRNLTGFPQTYALPRIFMDVVDDLSGHTGSGAAQVVADALRGQSASDETFLDRLVGPVYEDNSDVTRFVLTSLEQSAMTKETIKDLWRRENGHYVWTIEHILPQGPNLPTEWQAMLGGKSAAAAAQGVFVHRLGNLTITGYNGSLSNKSFDEKKARKDSDGKFIGFKNGLALNEDVVNQDKWTAKHIETRTAELARRTLALFPLALRVG